MIQWLQPDCVMVGASAPSLGSRQCEPRPSHTKHFKNGTCCFLACHSVFKTDSAWTNNHRLTALAQAKMSQWPQALKFLVKEYIIYFYIHLIILQFFFFFNLQTNLRVYMRNFGLSSDALAILWCKWFIDRMWSKWAEMLNISIRAKNFCEEKSFV